MTHSNQQSSNTEDTRDFETRLRQDLGMQEWQIRDLMPIVDALYLPLEQVQAAIGSSWNLDDNVSSKAFTEGRKYERFTIRSKLGLTPDHPTPNPTKPFKKGGPL